MHQEVAIIKPHSDVCYICDKQYEALLRRRGQRLLKAGIPVVEVAEAEKPRLLKPLGISADHLHYLNKEKNHYLHSDLLIPWENEEQYALHLDTIHWPFILVYDKILCFSCTYLLYSFVLFVCLIMLEMDSNFAQVFST